MSHASVETPEDEPDHAEQQVTPAVALDSVPQESVADLEDTADETERGVSALSAPPVPSSSGAETSAIIKLKGRW